MVEYTYSLDAVFGSLSDPTRRDILRRISAGGMTIGAIAEHYKLTFAGIAKHLKVLERAGLIKKTRQGKEQYVEIDPQALSAANDYLEMYRQLWEARLDSLDAYLKVISKEGNNNGSK